MNIKRKYSHLTRIIRDKLMKVTLMVKIVLVFIVVIMFSSSVISLISYYKISKFIQEKNNIFAQNLCATIMNSIDSQIKDMDRISKIILGNPDIQRILSESQEENYDNYNKIRDFAIIRDLAISIMSVSDRIRVSIYHKDGNAYFIEPNVYSKIHSNLFDNEWLEINKRDIDSRTLFLIPPEKTQIKFINDRSVFLVIRCLKTIEENDIVGYITVASSIDVLNNILLSNIPPGSDIMIEILDQYGNLVTYVGNKSISNNEKGGISVTFIKQTSDICGWSTIVYVPNSAINLNLVGIKKDTIVVWGVVIFCSVILIVFISRHTLKPLSHFVQSMNKVENGDFDIKLDYSGLTYEVRQLYKGFNKMVNEIKNLIKNLNEEKLLVKTAQIEALQFQINPHFLYNTLQTMESIGEVKGVPEIQTISNSLGNLLRYNIQGKNIVSINDEIKQIITYFTIQKIRFGDKLDYFIHIDDEIKNCKILKFILQPLVENSMVHGLDGIEGTGLIVINGVNNNGVIQIEISDNGKGIDHQKMNEINRKLEIIRTSKPFIMDDKCVGILNVQKRLVNFYGKEYGIRYKNCTQGTVVVINIPAIFDDEE